MKTPGKAGPGPNLLTLLTDNGGGQSTPEYSPLPAPRGTRSQCGSRMLWEQRAPDDCCSCPCGPLSHLTSQGRHRRADLNTAFAEPPTAFATFSAMTESDNPSNVLPRRHRSRESSEEHNQRRGRGSRSAHARGASVPTPPSGPGSAAAAAAILGNAQLGPYSGEGTRQCRRRRHSPARRAGA